MPAFLASMSADPPHGRHRGPDVGAGLQGVLFLLLWVVREPGRVGLDFMHKRHTLCHARCGASTV